MKQFFLELFSLKILVLFLNFKLIKIEESVRPNHARLNSFRQVPITWAGRVRIGNKQAFEYVKDFEVSCRFNENFSRENIYKEIEKTKWPLSRVIRMVLRPGGLVDFTLRSKESAVNFAQQLKNLDSIKSATAYADSVVEVSIDFIPPGFPSDPILSYLH